MAGNDAALGRFLRARREQLSPGEVGLPDSGRRRVPGLRREELALLAGISPNYYVRLEQGHSRQPSAQVVAALAAALRLGDDERRHLEALAAPPDAEVRRRARVVRETIRPELARMLDRHVDAPAFVLGSTLDVLAANRLARALHPSFQPRRNIVHDVFLDDAAMAAYPDLDHVRRNAVASLRHVAGQQENPRLTELVGTLSLKSPDFRRLWARHEVRGKIAGTKHFNHPVLGPVELDYDSFTVSGATLQQLIVYHAAPGTAGASALALLDTDLASDPEAATPRSR